MEYSNLILLLLKLRSELKLTHWLNIDKRYSTHKALDFLYDELESKVDLFAESYIGKNGLPSDINSFVISDISNINIPVEYLMNILVMIKEERDNVTIKENSFLLNIIDEIDALINQTIYKLKYTI